MAVKKLRYSRVPDSISRQFENAEKILEKFFSSLQRAPEKGEIVVDGERYVLLRGSALAVDAINYLSELMGRKAANRTLYYMAKGVGASDARAFCERYRVEDPASHLSLGPAHFAFAGYGTVIIHEESNITPDDSYFLMYDHPNTFESEAYLRRGVITAEPVCFFSAGYSAGWCEECFNMRLDAREVACRARGDPYCRFIMAPPRMLLTYIEEYFPEE